MVVGRAVVAGFGADADARQAESSDRKDLCGILFRVAYRDSVEYQPKELGFGSGTACWRWLAALNEAGVWGWLHVVLLARLRAAKQLDWSRAVIDFPHVRAARRGPKAAPARLTELVCVHART